MNVGQYSFGTSLFQGGPVSAVMLVSDRPPEEGCHDCNTPLTEDYFMLHKSGAAYCTQCHFGTTLNQPYPTPRKRLQHLSTPEPPVPPRRKLRHL